VDGSRGPIDWVKYAAGILSRANDTVGTSWSPIGDPTRWGSRDDVTLPVVGEGSVAVVATQQLVRVQAIDKYSRNFQIIGNIALPQTVWDLDAAGLQIGLQVTMGVGQAALLQTFNVRALIAQAAPWYIDGGGGAGNVVKAFTVSGGVVGNTVNAVVVFTLAATLAGAVSAGAELQLSPFSAGFGI
jgi:hypothetical protein